MVVGSWGEVGSRWQKVEGRRDRVSRVPRLAAHERCRRQENGAGGGLDI